MNNFRSVGEKRIAEILNKYNIDFVYEHPLLIREHKDGDSEKLRIWYPDFWLPKYSIVIEYFGRKNDKTYDMAKRAKLQAYRRMDIDFISVKPSTIAGNLKSYLLMSIKRLINDKVRHFENRNKKNENILN
jgi:hypothetical protein